MLEVADAHGKTLADLTAAIATKASGKIDPGAFNFGKENARKVTAPFHMDAYTSRVSYLAVHQDRLYIASVLNTAAQSGEKLLGDLLASVKFSTAESPAKHTKELFDTPMNIFDCFTMNGPKCLRRTDNQPGLLHLVAKDFTTGKDPLNVDLQRIQTQTNKPFSEIRDAYSAQLRTSLNLPAPLVWKTTQELPDLNLSQPVKTIQELPDGSQIKVTQRFCILQLEPGDFVQILFVVGDGPEAEDAVYQQACNQMLVSIKKSTKART